MMFPSIPFDQTEAFSLLREHFKQIEPIHLREFFDQEDDRAQHFSIHWKEFLFDYSKNRINRQTLELLIQLANECKLKEAISAMFSGEAINQTENRQVLHTALRNKSADSVLVDGRDVMPDIRSALNKMREFTESVHSGTRTGYTGRKLQHIVNIGIGGSDLGPVMVSEALHPWWVKGIQMHFVSNVDGTHISETLKKLDPETTLFIIASKTFTTQETMANARTARDWFVQQSGSETAVSSHFIALSTNDKAVQEFGINKENQFVFWDWVGGRYSLWSSIGLSICLAVGFENFDALLQGAYEMDVHFKSAPFSENMPVILALLGIWYTNFFEAESQAILPYDQYLHRFPAYLQQADMESNGKSVNRKGQMIHYHTGQVICGEPGTNGQHAFYQLIHQGTRMIPVDFIAPAISQNKVGRHHDLLLSNFFAQSQALMNGKNEEEVRAELLSKGMKKEEIAFHLPFRVFKGNRPSNSILIKELNPRNLGALIALYEHKIFVQGLIWNIFSFDQWGVELGKQLAGKILHDMEDKAYVLSHDSSTNQLINTWKDFQNNS